MDELINDKCYQNIFMGIFTPKNKTIFHQDELDAFNAYAEKSSSKKSDA